jgi:hypothetical protein
MAPNIKSLAETVATFHVAAAGLGELPLLVVPQHDYCLVKGFELIDGIRIAGQYRAKRVVARGYVVLRRANGEPKDTQRAQPDVVAGYPIFSKPLHVKLGTRSRSPAPLGPLNLRLILLRPSRLAPKWDIPSRVAPAGSLVASCRPL